MLPISFPESKPKSVASSAIIFAPTPSPPPVIAFRIFPPNSCILPPKRPLFPKSALPTAPRTPPVAMLLAVLCPNILDKAPLDCGPNALANAALFAGSVSEAINACTAGDAFCPNKKSLTPPVPVSISVIAFPVCCSINWSLAFCCSEYASCCSKRLLSSVPLCTALCLATSPKAILAFMGSISAKVFALSIAICLSKEACPISSSCNPDPYKPRLAIGWAACLIASGMPDSNCFTSLSRCVFTAAGNSEYDSGT